jgi:hypothetical protein
MACYLITYDLAEKSRESDLLAYIKGGPWAKAAESSYAIVTDKTPVKLVVEIRQVANDTITLCVVSIRKPWDGYLRQEVVDWMNANLP